VCRSSGTVPAPPPFLRHLRAPVKGIEMLPRGRPRLRAVLRHEGRPVLRWLGMRLREYDGHHPEADGADRLQPHPVARDEVLRPLGHKTSSCAWVPRRPIKNYFRKYDECASNDFVLTTAAPGRAAAQRHHRLAHHLRDTGVNASIGQRLKAVEPHLADEEAFLASYSDA